MHTSYFSFKKQAGFINPFLCGATIRKIFTAQPRELVLEVDSAGNTLFLVLSHHQLFPGLFLLSSYPERKIRLQLFTSLGDKTIQSLSLAHSERMIKIDCGDAYLLARFSGPDTNTLLYTTDGVVHESFLKNISSPLPADFDNPPFDLQELHKYHFPPPAELTEFLKNNFRVLNNRMIREIIFRLTIRVQNGTEIPYQEYAGQIIDQICTEMNQAAAWKYDLDGRLKYFSLFRLQHLENDVSCHGRTEPDFNTSWYSFSRAMMVEKMAEELRTRIGTVLRRKKEYLAKVRHGLEEADTLRQKQDQARQTGNLILSNLHNIKPGVSEVMLENFYSENGEIIRIKLDPKKSAVENAQTFFSKYSEEGIRQRIEKNQIKSRALREETERLAQFQSKFDQAESVAGLEKIEEQLIRSGWMTSRDPKRGHSDREPSGIIPKYPLDERHFILIGRNGLENDRITFQLAGRDDLWFHAQGVSGAHVILKSNGPLTPGKKLIEQAAAIAAAHSQARHSGLVPVIYTRVRHVSRIRKQPPGTVRVSNEEVIFVVPKDIH